MPLLQGSFFIFWLVYLVTNIVGIGEKGSSTATSRTLTQSHKLLTLQFWHSLWRPSLPTWIQPMPLSQALSLCISSSLAMSSSESGTSDCF